MAELNEDFHKRIGGMQNRLCRKVVGACSTRNLVQLGLHGSSSTDSSLLDRVGTRWTRQGLVRCMNRWKRTNKRNKRLALVQTCGGTPDESRACGYYGKMECFVEQRLKDKSIVRRWLASVKNRELSSGWRAWIAFVHQCEKDEQVSEVDDEIADMMHARSRLVMYRFIIVLRSCASCSVRSREVRTV